MQRQSPRFRVRVQWITDRSYFIVFTSGIRAKLELTKRGLPRLKALYFGMITFAKCQTLRETIANLLKVRIDIRAPRYTVGQHEVRVSNFRIEQMAKIELFIKELLNSIQPAPNKVVSIYPDRPTITQPTTYRAGGRTVFQRGSIAVGID